MRKIELLKNFIDDIDRRKREITNLITFVEWVSSMEYYYKTTKWKRKNPNYYIKKDIDIVIKSWIVIFYSHWEGFIKESGRDFLKYLSTLNLKRDKIHKSFLDYFIYKNDKDLYVVLSKMLDDDVIPVYEDMLDNTSNMDIKTFKSFFEKIWFDFNVFLKSFELYIKSETWLIEDKDFLKRVSIFKKKNHYLVEYIETNISKINTNKTLENILKVDKNNPNLKWLIVLRHKIAHWDDIIVDLHRFKCLWKISILLLDVFKSSFEESLKKPEFT